MAETAAIISAIAAVGSGVAANRSASAQNKAQKRAGALERAQAQVEHNRNVRRAIAARRLQQAQLIQAGQTEGLSFSSSISGAVGSLTTQTASNIGTASSILGAQLGQSRALQRGASRAARFGTISNTLGSIGQASGTISSSPEASAFLKNQFSNIFGPRNG